MGKHRDFDNDIWEENEQSLRHFRGSAHELEDIFDNASLRGKVDKRRKKMDADAGDIL